jgi:hypothetical protein
MSVGVGLVRGILARLANDREPASKALLANPLRLPHHRPQRPLPRKPFHRHVLVPFPLQMLVLPRLQPAKPNPKFKCRMPKEARIPNDE